MSTERRPWYSVSPWLWKPLLVFAAFLAGAVFLFVGIFGVPVQTYTVSYPAAVYTEDGKKIVFLERRSLGGYTIGGFHVSSTDVSKTYLGVMDRDGRGKRIVGEVPNQSHYGELVALSRDHGISVVISQSTRLAIGGSIYASPPKTDKFGYVLKGQEPSLKYKQSSSYFFRPPWWKL